MSGAAAIRRYRPDDLEDLYAVCLATGDAGADAAHLYRDPKLIGHIYAGPYGVLEPGLVLVAEDAEGVGGYIVGAADTRAFETRLEAEWWPALRAAYPDPSGIPAAERTVDQQRSFRIHHPLRTPDWLVGPYPAHLHINLLPRLQGRGLGRRLIERWFDAVGALGASGVHLGVHPDNHRAMGFYRAFGFTELERRAPDMPQAVWFAMPLGGGG